LAQDDAFAFDSAGSGASASAGASASGRKRISVPLDDSGKLDVASMRPGTVDSLRRALDGSSLFSEPSVDAATIEAKKLAFMPMVAPAYKLLGSLESWLAAKRTKLPYHDVEAIMGYSELEIEALTPATAIVLAKRLPEGFGWAEEMALAMLLVSFHQEKLLALQELQARASKKIVNIQDTSQERDVKSSVQ